MDHCKKKDELEYVASGVSQYNKKNQSVWFKTNSINNDMDIIFFKMMTHTKKYV